MCISWVGISKSQWWLRKWEWKSRSSSGGTTPYKEQHRGGRAPSGSLLASEPSHSLSSPVEFGTCGQPTAWGRRESVALRPHKASFQLSLGKAGEGALAHRQPRPGSVRLNSCCCHRCLVGRTRQPCPWKSALGCWRPPAPLGRMLR